MALEADPPHLGDTGDPTAQPLDGEAGPVVDRQEERVLEAVEDEREDEGGGEEGSLTAGPPRGERPRRQLADGVSETERDGMDTPTAAENGQPANGLPDFDPHFEVGAKGERFRARGAPLQGLPDEELLERMCEARLEIDTIGRSGYNDNLDHAYATYDDVMEAIAKPMAEAGVWCLESVVDTVKRPAGTNSYGNQQYVVTMVLETVWTDGSSSFRQRWIGESVDTGEHHHYQLLSQLTKYAYAKTLKLDTGDIDVDAPGPGPAAQVEAEGPEAAANGASPNGGGGSGEPATDRQQSYIRNLQEKCLARGGDEDEHEVLQVVATDKTAASEQIDELKRLEKTLAGAGADE